MEATGGQAPGILKDIHAVHGELADAETALNEAKE